MCMVVLYWTEVDRNVGAKLGFNAFRCYWVLRDRRTCNIKVWGVQLQYLSSYLQHDSGHVSVSSMPSFHNVC